MECSSKEMEMVETLVGGDGGDGTTNSHNDTEDVVASNIVIESFGKSPLPKNLLEPYEGMEFDSLDSAKNYYEEYARSIGFCTRVHNNTKSRKDGTLITQEYVCHKQGFRHEKYKNRVNRVYPIRDETRTGCRAIFVVSKRGDAKWVVSRLVLGHNHEFPSPRSRKFLPAKRQNSKAQRMLIDVLDESGVKPSKIMSVLATEAGGIDQVCINETNVRNYLSNKKQKNIEKGDAQRMLTYFQEQQSKNPGFFYAIQVDSEGHLANCFWVDARSRMAYKHFGDVVTFDPTYLTNKYRMPFVPFTGVNHHRQSILFGCALLWDETEETFVWLLQTWLEAMFGKLPRTIITDQDHAITKAITKVFSGSVVHHFCMWHILKKVPETLGKVYSQHKEFKDEFNKCIHQSITPDEFEFAWAQIIQKYDLEKNVWLNRIYLVREKWIPAYLRGTFCAGMSTTQRSESMNSFFKDYVSSSTSMSVFVLQYEKALDSRYDKEREKSFKTRNSKPLFKTLYPIEAQAAQSYTRKIFRLFQEELVQSDLYISEKVDVIDGVYSYKVHEFNKEKPFFIVNLNLELEEAFCTCKKFEFEGILCRHILMIFKKKKIFSLPSRYILKRWTIDATKDTVDGVWGKEPTGSESRPATWFNSLMVRSFGVAEMGSLSLDHYNSAMLGLEETLGKLNLLPTENENSLATKIAPGIDTTSPILLCSQDNNLSLRDPPHAASKGRPRSLRVKGHLEKNSKKTCSVCQTKGHTKPTCPTLKKPRYVGNLEETSNPEAG